MICRHFKHGQKLNVADLNEITVLVDRSETGLTEVALNRWRAGLDGPPHFHAQKEQLFFITAGTGRVKIAGACFPAELGDLFYVPAGVIHQTLTAEGVPLEYLLFNAFLSPDKEGHASFAAHIEQVKATRYRQAQSQQAGESAEPGGTSPQAQGRHFPAVGGRAPRAGCTLVLHRSETARCEVALLSCPAGARSAPEADPSKEQTLFILQGRGSISAGKETQAVQPGDVLFLPGSQSFGLQAGAEPLSLLALGTRLN